MAFGEILRNTRTELGWSKEYISERTNLMTRIIDALESENLKRIPAPIYGRGFIRQYCTLLGIDPQPLLDDYARLTKSPIVQVVTHPTPHDLPAKPLDPIHTGAKRTLPPQTPPAPKPTQPTPAKHKYVESAEETFTSVPKPEVPIAPQPEAEPRPTLSLEGDTLPLDVRPPEPAPVPAARPTPPSEKNAWPAPPPPPQSHSSSTGRAALLERVEASAHPRKEVAPSHSLEPLRSRPKSDGSIFSPQRPAPDPRSPQVSTLRLIGAKFGKLFKKICSGIAFLIRGITRPKVERLSDNNDPVLNKRALLRAATIFGVLVALTGLVFAFRYVFRQSADAEIETTLQGGTPGAEFVVRPLTPPLPYFK